MRALMLCAILCGPVLSAGTVLEFLQSEPRPAFREGHTLLPLTRWGWSLPFEVSRELAESWYAFIEGALQEDDDEGEGDA